MIIGHAASVAASIAAAEQVSRCGNRREETAGHATRGRRRISEYMQAPHEKASQIIREGFRPKGISRFNWE